MTVTLATRGEMWAYYTKDTAGSISLLKKRTWKYLKIKYNSDM